MLIGVLSFVVHVLVLLVAGRAGKALLTDGADQRALFGVHVHVALQVRHQTEGLAALGAAVTCHLGVHLQRDGIGERLETQGAVVEVFRVRLLMVEERACVAVGAPTKVTPAEKVR